MITSLSFSRSSPPIPPPAKPYHVLHEVISNKISKMDINKTALVPFYYTYTSGGVFGFYANGAASEATALLQVITTLVHCLFHSCVLLHLCHRVDHDVIPML